MPPPHRSLSLLKIPHFVFLGVDYTVSLSQSTWWFLRGSLPAGAPLSLLLRRDCDGIVFKVHGMAYGGVVTQALCYLKQKYLTSLCLNFTFCKMR